MALGQAGGYVDDERGRHWLMFTRIEECREMSIQWSTRACCMYTSREFSVQAAHVGFNLFNAICKHMGRDGIKMWMQDSTDQVIGVWPNDSLSDLRDVIESNQAWVPFKFNLMKTHAAPEKFHLSIAPSIFCDTPGVLQVSLTADNMAALKINADVIDHMVTQSDNALFAPDESRSPDVSKWLSDCVTQMHRDAEKSAEQSA